MEAEIGVYKTLVRKLEGKNYLDDLSMDGNIKLHTEAKRWIGMDWIHLSNSAGSCEHANELSDSTKCEEVLD